MVRRRKKGQGGRERERARGNGARERQKEGKERIGRTAGQDTRARACAWPRNRAERSLSLLAYDPQARSWPDEVMSPPWPASAMPPRPPASSWIFKEFNSILVEYCKRGCVSQEFD